MKLELKRKTDNVKQTVEYYIWAFSEKESSCIYYSKDEDEALERYNILTVSLAGKTFLEKTEIIRSEEV